MASSSEWANALWEFYYPSSNRASPAYLSMDDEELLAIASGLGLPLNLDIQTIKKDLANCVLDDLQLTQPASIVLARIVTLTRSWFASSKTGLLEITGAPPQLPFLAVTVLAARELGGESENSIAFYRKLMAVLGVREEFQGKFQTAYRKDIEFLWGALNSALIHMNYARGVPTASSLTQRYASIPISQSVIRLRDRRKLIGFFMDVDLGPDSIPSDFELEQLFELWLNRGGHSISTNLETLWRRGKAERRRVLEVITKELESWDGSPPDEIETSRSADRVKVILQRDKDWFGEESIAIGLAIQIKNLPLDTNHLEVTGTSGVRTAERLGSTDYFQLGTSADFSREDALISEVSLQAEEVGDQRRVAKSIYVLKFNPDLQLFVEAGKPSLGEPCLIICSEQLGIAAKVRDVLSRHASEDTSELAADVHGLDGWQVFQDVRFEYPFQHTSDLAPLSTNNNASLVFIGGLKLGEEPGVRVWSKYCLPTVEVSIPEGAVIKLQLDGGNGRSREFTEYSKVGFGRVQFNLQEFELGDGEYALRAEIGGDAPQVLTRKFFVRSEDSPRTPPFSEEEVLGFSLLKPTRPLWLPRGSGWSAFPDASKPQQIPEHAIDVPKIPSWPDARYRFQKPQLTRKESPIADAASCSFSGAHHWDLGECKGQQKYVEAVCRNCRRHRREACKGYLVNNFRTQAAKVLESPSRQTPISIEVAQRVEEPSSQKAYALHKSLGYLKAGIYKEIKDAAASLGMDAITTRKITRWLEVSGSIEIEDQFREDATWAMNPASFVRAGDGSFRLIGDVSSTLLAGLKDHLGQEQLRVTRSAFGYEVMTAGVDPEKVTEAASALGITVVHRPSENLRGWTLPLSELLDGQRLAPLPDGKAIERFNVKTADWDLLDHGRVGGVGTFRVQGPFSKSVYYVPEGGVATNQGFRLDTVLAKHIACFFAAAPLMSYSPEEQAIYVPIGMELPGLVGRLAVSASGKPPVEIWKKFDFGKVAVIRYDNIDSVTAGIVYSCLGGKQ